MSTNVRAALFTVGFLSCGVAMANFQTIKTDIKTDVGIVKEQLTPAIKTTYTTIKSAQPTVKQLPSAIKTWYTTNIAPVVKNLGSTIKMQINIKK
ncbi:MAG: hypothetical protein ACRCXC_10235 [Legionella sp.]